MEWLREKIRFQSQAKGRLLIRMMSTLSIWLDDVWWRVWHGRDTWSISLMDSGTRRTRNGRVVGRIDSHSLCRIRAMRKDCFTHAPVYLACRAQKTLSKYMSSLMVSIVSSLLCSKTFPQLTSIGDRLSTLVTPFLPTSLCCGKLNDGPVEIAS